MDNWTDEALMRAYQDGDEAAFHLLYDRYHSKIYGYFYKKTARRELADELFQKFFLRLHEHRERYDDRYPLLPWIFTICHNLYVDELRAMASRSSLEQSFAQEGALLTDWASEQDESQQDLELLLSEQIRKLNPRYQQALVMRYSDGKAFEEIADSLATTPSTARKVVSRAVQSLRQIMRSWKDAGK